MEIIIEYHDTIISVPPGRIRKPDDYSDEHIQIGDKIYNKQELMVALAAFNSL